MKFRDLTPGDRYEIMMRNGVVRRIRIEKIDRTGVRIDWGDRVSTIAPNTWSTCYASMCTKLAEFEDVEDTDPNLRVPEFKETPREPQKDTPKVFSFDPAKVAKLIEQNDALAKRLEAVEQLCVAILAQIEQDRYDLKNEQS